MAEYVYHFLLNQTDFWVREAARVSQRTNRGKLSPIARRSYRLGILEGFARKLRASEITALKTEHPKSEPTASNRYGSIAPELSLVGMAVEKFKQDPRLDQYISQIYPRLLVGRSSWQSIDNASFYAGTLVGKKLTLNKAVETKHGNLGRLLPGDQ